MDLTAGTLLVQRQLSQDGVVSEPKTATGRRTTALSPTCVAVLREHRRQQHEERLAIGPAWEHHDLIFCTRHGRALSQRNVLREFKRLLVRAGVRDVPFHALRHIH
ncbi:MAG TPA: tyrosine-type recombinase/integrase [Nitrolancea sp.]|nr:tyrosine-type recombinase/integrase [Nitrolancea sp.]